MHTEHHRHGCGCHGEQSRGPEMYYGYCHDSGRMRMMNYPDYMQNMQTGFSNMMQGTMMQPLINAMTGMANPAAGSMGQTSGPSYGQGGNYSYHHHRHHHDDDCGCHGGGHHHHDEDHCGCHCCIRCADLVEYARCGEVRRIPVTFDNDTRRERNVKLSLGAFATQSGQETGWQAQLSESEFKLGPCGHKTIVVSVTVDCSKIGTTQTPPAGTTAPPANATNANGDRTPSVDSCKVAYASLTAEGCSVRPLVLAVAILPEHCYAHEASCGCGCCH